MGQARVDVLLGRPRACRSRSSGGLAAGSGVRQARARMSAVLCSLPSPAASSSPLGAPARRPMAPHLGLVAQLDSDAEPRQVPGEPETPGCCAGSRPPPPCPRRGVGQGPGDPRSLSPASDLLCTVFASALSRRASWWSHRDSSPPRVLRTVSPLTPKTLLPKFADRYSTPIEVLDTPGTERVIATFTPNRIVAF